MNDFVKYLNGLHNYRAQNQNAYGERNIESPYYEKTMVSIDICDYIVSSISKEKPHTIILTGHAGDGKTSIMFQVLKELGVESVPINPIQTVTTDDGTEICCVKDFSELSDEKKLQTMQELFQLPEKGIYVFMVANTGPLINTFGKMFGGDEENIAAMQLIEAMDSNDGEIKKLYGNDIMVINIAAIDNSGFARKFLDKILCSECWEPCNTCPKNIYCHIYRNHKLANFDRAKEFIEDFYIWQTEYGTRLTIRSMAEHLAFMITGGDDCAEVEASFAHEKLFPNLFFGYEGLVSNPLAENILAVRTAKKSEIFLRRLRADEELLIRRNYKELFTQDVNSILDEISNSTKIHSEFDNELRRIYLFLNIVDDAQHKKDVEDLFSKQFLPYLSVRNNGNKPTKQQKNLVIDALRMMYLGTVISNTTMIPITMGTEGGLAQNVQLIAGELNSNDIELVANEDSTLNKGRKNLALRIKRKEICSLTLPMMDHFEELKNGVIATNLDPQLSRGIENMKAQLLELADTDKDRFDFLVMNNDGYKPETIIIEDGTITLQ